MKRISALILFFVALLGVFLFVGFLQPVSIHLAKQDAVWYGDTPLSVKQVSVTYRSFFGQTWSVPNDVLKVEGDTKTGIVTITDGKFTDKAKWECTFPDELQVKYDGTPYEGQSLDDKQLHVYAKYGDDLHEIHTYEIDNRPLPHVETLTMEIQVPCGKGKLKLSVEPVTSIVTTYDGALKLGDKINPKKFQTVLKYKDGSTYVTDEAFLSEVPSVLSGKTTVQVNTPYGDTTCVLQPSNMKGLKVSYDGELRVGEKLNKDCILFGYVDKSDEFHEVMDFTYDDPGIIQNVNDVKVGIDSAYGNCTLDLKPVKISRVIGHFTSSFEVGTPVTLDGCTLIYGDGITEDVTSDNLVFENLGVHKGKERNVQVLYQDVALSVPYYGLEDVQRIDITSQSDIRYSLTSEQLNELSVMVQSVSGEDVDMARNQITRVLEQYESVKGDVASGWYLGDDFIAYAKESGVFKESHYYPVETVKQVVFDVLTGGYRGNSNATIPETIVITSEMLEHN